MTEKEILDKGSTSEKFPVEIQSAAAETAAMQKLNRCRSCVRACVNMAIVWYPAMVNIAGAGDALTKLAMLVWTDAFKNWVCQAMRA